MRKISDITNSRTSSPGIAVDFFVFLFFKIINLFIYFWLHSVFTAMCRVSLVAASGGYSSLWCVGFSLRWLLFAEEHGL